MASIGAGPAEALKGRYKLARGHSRAHELQSMPSGHSAGVVGGRCFGLDDYPEAAAPVVGASAAVLAAQLPSQNHFLTDVAAGSANRPRGFRAGPVGCFRRDAD